MEQVLLIQDGEKTIINSTDFANENEIQEIIKENPSLINLSSIFNSPIMIIGRENAHIDVLAITAEAVPVIIECKRKENPDMRYLIAQIIEYASKLEQMSYAEFDAMVSKYFNSERCNESSYKGLELKEAFRKFTKQFENIDYKISGNEFVNTVSNNLRDGEFYLVMVVDVLSETTLRTVNYLNKKFEKLRIEVIEISKFKKAGYDLFVPKHINNDRDKVKPQPGTISFEEMIQNCSSRDAEIVSEFRIHWANSPEYSIKMGTKGFSARYRNIPVLFVLPNHFRIAPNIKRNNKILFDLIIEIMENNLKKELEVGVRFSSLNLQSNDLQNFIDQIKNIFENHPEFFKQ